VRVNSVTYLLFYIYTVPLEVIFVLGGGLALSRGMCAMCANGGLVRP
jgi:hypothetical protein